MPALIQQSENSQAKYSPEEIEAGLLAVAFVSGNHRKAHEILAEQYKDSEFQHPEWEVPPAETLRQWRKTHEDRYLQIQNDLQPQIKAELANQHQDLARRASDAAALIVDRIVAEVDDIPVKDLAKALQAVSTAAGINVDKGQLLRGEATTIYKRELPEIMRALEAKGVVIDSTAVEVPVNESHPDLIAEDPPPAPTRSGRKARRIKP